MCSPHYYQWRRNGFLKPIRVAAEPVECKADGCLRLAAAKGYCRVHYDQMRRRGETWVIGTRRGPGRPRGCGWPGCSTQSGQAYCDAHRATANGICVVPSCREGCRSRANPFCDTHARDDRRLRFFYGISIVEREAAMTKQAGLCAICRQGRPLHVDHEHSTKRFRGMLCGSCNRAIGLLGEDPEMLERAAEYLRRGEVSPDV